MEQYTCESCGHKNPNGTVFCASCGLPLEKEASEQRTLLNMRYEGSARRSQTKNKTIIDKIWNFFSSVKVGVTLIFITLVASAIGTIFPQEMYIPPTVEPAQHYADQYGIFGQIYYQLGFHNLYSSWWYMVLIALIGISIVVASIDRVVPLYKALKNQKPTRHENFLRGQRLFSETETVSSEEKQEVVKKLRQLRYRVTEENGHVLAEKGRFSRWGPYVNHIGLIVFLLGALLRFVPFMYIDDYVWVREGETKVVPSTDQQYYVKNEDFIVETYDENDERYKESLAKQGVVPSNFQTNAVVYKNTNAKIPGAEPELEVLKEDSIKVNHPLKFDGFALYQSNYQLNEFKSMTFRVHRTDDPDEKALGTFQIDLMDPKSEYTLDNGFRVVIDQYFPDYYMSDGEPRSQSKYPKNPAFVFFVYPPNETEPEISFAGIGRNVPSGDNEYKIGIEAFEMRDVTGLTVKRDYTLPFIALGGLIFMIGVVQGMYWHHRRIWIHPTENGLLLAGHTNKNYFGVKKDIEKIIEGTSITMVEDQQEKK
ncbi:cytochrome c biogenesis protein ResB [Radiobacillus deserti]|uniref:Cytochrome C biogenesis protein n=1 Tax=Radiobacillus deserti TaxID=2594883 RepID=A0A516KGI6_9BACI|nr:cytochrome c biogenesis protein ResB [Radiobacillus deserti]QDP40505.1 cytochrome C biogenesis protein [Radiobacillus deserti]